MPTKLLNRKRCLTRFNGYPSHFFRPCLTSPWHSHCYPNARWLSHIFSALPWLVAWHSRCYPTLDYSQYSRIQAISTSDFVVDIQPHFEFLMLTDVGQCCSDISESSMVANVGKDIGIASYRNILCCMHISDAESANLIDWLIDLLSFNHHYNRWPISTMAIVETTFWLHFS